MVQETTDYGLRSSKRIEGLFCEEELFEGRKYAVLEVASCDGDWIFPILNTGGVSDGTALAHFI